jgi:putative FmdB family regulatory protein
VPIFLFVCDDCGRHFESIIKADEIKDQRCIACNSEYVVRAITSHGDYAIKGNNSASTRPRRVK